VPGDYWDALNGNTKLGKAVKAAVQELEHLGTLVSRPNAHRSCRRASHTHVSMLHWPRPALCTPTHPPTGPTLWRQHQEHDVLEQCDGLLKQLGMQGSLFGSSAGGADADSLLARLQQELLLQEQLEQEQAEEQAQAEQAPKEGGK
jgi:hypothetical protein